MECLSREKSAGCRPDKVFPVYAMGWSDHDSDHSIFPGFGSDVISSDPIWDAIRDQAKLEAEKEPILSSFLYASILSHNCLEQALAFVLADRLQNSTLLATQLMDICCNVIMRDRGIQRSIRLDIQAFKDRDPSCISYCSVLLYPKGFQAIQTYRVAHALWSQGRKVLALALQSRVSEVFGIDIHPAAKIGEGVLLDHGTGVVIGETAVIGNRVSLMQGVTLGGTGKETGDRHPKVGDGALIGASVIILGNIIVGEGAMVAAGSLVLKSVPPHSMVAGIPAKVIGYMNEQDPSLTMKHDASKGFFELVASNSNNARCSGSEDPGRLN
uniref:serine O-acetyltransferase n=1 Tax=Kalanchoe fedtschenkoi TaxID=63787 RepID=A0A7N1A2B0_KALFE